MDLEQIDGGAESVGFIKKNGMYVVLVLCVLILACLIYPVGGYSSIVIGVLAVAAGMILGWMFVKL